MRRSAFHADASQSPATTPPPCRRYPDRWFDRANRTDALATCLACPVRSWCAQHALQQRASWGMWAGIWIDGRLDDVAHYLHAIAAGTPARHPRRANAATPPPPRAQATRRPTPTHTTARSAPPPPRTPADRPSLRAVLMIRSSGHCEIMAPGCRYTSDKIASRLAGGTAEDADASVVYIICRVCAATLSQLDRQIAVRLGYLVGSPGRAAAVPFYWRQSRWVQLAPAGGLCETASGADCA